MCQFLLLLFCNSIYAKSRAFGFCEDGAKTVTTAGVTSTTKVQQSFPSCTVTVYNGGTAVLATIFSDNSGTPLGNPFTASASGYWFFYAANSPGRYDVKFSGGGIPAPFTHADYPLFDIADYTAPGSGTVNSGTATHLAYYATTTNAVSDMGADLTFASHTLTGGASLLFDLGASNMKPPAAAGFTSTTTNRFGINTTTGKPKLWDPVLAADETLLRVIDIPVVTTPTDYGVMYYRNSAPPTTLTTSAGTAAYPLLSAGAGAAPAYGQLNLAGAGLTGILAIANGGTGLTASEGNGTKFQRFTGADPAANDCAKFDANKNIVGAGGGCVSGTGTAGVIPKFTGTAAIGNSIMSDNGAGAIVTSGANHFDSAGGYYVGGTQIVTNAPSIGNVVNIANTGTLSVGSGKFFVNASGVTTKYNNVSTAGNGQAAIEAVVDLTGQIATIGPTALLTAPAAGFYMLHSYTNTVTVAGGACTLVLSYGWTDSTGAKSQNEPSMDLNAATDHQDNTDRIWVASGNVTYTGTVAGVGCGGAQRWDIHLRAEAL